MDFYSSKENQEFYINNIKLSGIQALDLKWESSVEPSLLIENNSKNYINSKFIEADLGIEYIPLANDILLNFTGNTPFSGKFNYNDKYFIFKTGFLNNYSLNYEIDSVVSAKANLKIFAEVYSETGLEILKPANFNILPYNNNYVDIYFDSSVVDKALVNKLNLTIECEKRPSYKIGQILPDEFISMLPLKISLSLFANINEYTFSGVTSIYNKPDIQDLTLKLKSYVNGSNLYSFTFKDLTKSEETSNFSTIEEGRVNFNYYTLF